MYIYLLYEVTMWFMALNEPNMAQAGLVSVVVGAGAAWFGLYVNSTSTNQDVVGNQPIQQQHGYNSASSSKKR